MNSERELWIIGAVMLFLLIIAISASLIFLRQFRKERRQMNRNGKPDSSGQRSGTNGSLAGSPDELEDSLHRAERHRK